MERSHSSAIDHSCLTGIIAYLYMCIYGTNKATKPEPMNKVNGGIGTYGIIFEHFLCYIGGELDPTKNEPTPEILEARNIFNQAIVVDLCCGDVDLVEDVTLPFLSQNSTGFYYIGTDIGVSKPQRGNLYIGNKYSILRGDCTDYDMIQEEIDDARREFESTNLVFLLNAVDLVIPGYDTCHQITKNIKGWANSGAKLESTYITGYNNHPEHILRQNGFAEMLYSFNTIPTTKDLYTYSETVISKITL